MKRRKLHVGGGGEEATQSVDALLVKERQQSNWDQGSACLGTAIRSGRYVPSLTNIPR